jgi:chromosome segregation protein
MYLKRLEISGFKSFAAKSVLDFALAQNGKRIITAIVGPNGSGKSNIADAVRWAIGEQSMKTLRGKKAEDIIFNGSGKKARLGSAHVTLIFDNSDKKLPIEFDEVTVTRKIFRSGDSEFQINGSRVRLQDIVDLLAKAGIGKESYSIINQGMADAVLNASPLERRTLIEEAAGVKHFQIKKERAERKLELTIENLDKVQGIIEEIKPHLRMLKRQAEKAKQSEGVFTDLKDKQKQLFSFLWHNFQSERERLDKVKSEIGIKVMHIQRETDRLSDQIQKEAKSNQENKELKALEQERNEKRNKLNQLERELIVTEGRIEVESEKQKNMEILSALQKRSIPVDLQYVRAGLDEIREEQEKLIKKIESAESLSDLQDIKEFARVIQQRLYDLKSDIEKGKVEKNTPDGEKIARDAKAESDIIIKLREKLSDIRKNIESQENEAKNIDAKINQFLEADRKKRHEFFEMERQMRLKQDELGKLKDQFNESKIELAKVEVREEDLRAEIHQELRLKPEDLGAKQNVEDRDKLEKEINHLKLTMEKIGGIDPMVMDEYEETRKRFDFLTKESDDLKDAIAKLKEVIKEMEQKVDAKFHATFDEIEKEFTKYFRIIFGGGNASLKKVEIKKRSYKNGDTEAENAENNDDLEMEMPQEKEKIETGIEIFACPPGKKITSLSMLSGGERSLTSLALLFAIISHNPPPFAVLDEVEAALDEANSRRFGRIISELSSNTQFVIITHNRETMRNASLLYGVTMTEDGISKLLSVNMDQIGQGGKILKKE